MSMNRMETVLFDGFKREAAIVLESKITMDEVEKLLQEKFSADAGLLLEETVVDQQMAMEGIENTLHELRE